jgi:hypothetical protein
MMSRSFPMWVPPPAPTSDDPAGPPPFVPPPNRGWKRKNPPSSAAGYQPPALGDLQVQNRVKARRWFKNHNPPGTNRRPTQHHLLRHPGQARRWHRLPRLLLSCHARRAPHPAPIPLSRGPRGHGSFTVGRRWIRLHEGSHPPPQLPTPQR